MSQHQGPYIFEGPPRGDHSEFLRYLFQPDARQVSLKPSVLPRPFCLQPSSPSYTSVSSTSSRQRVSHSTLRSDQGCSRGTRPAPGRERSNSSGSLTIHAEHSLAVRSVSDSLSLLQSPIEAAPGVAAKGGGHSAGETPVRHLQSATPVLVAASDTSTSYSSFSEEPASAADRTRFTYSLLTHLANASTREAPPPAILINNAAEFAKGEGRSSSPQSDNRSLPSSDCPSHTSDRRERVARYLLHRLNRVGGSARSSAEGSRSSTFPQPTVETSANVSCGSNKSTRGCIPALFPDSEPVSLLCSCSNSDTCTCSCSAHDGYSRHRGLGSFSADGSRTSTPIELPLPSSPAPAAVPCAVSGGCGCACHCGAGCVICFPSSSSSSSCCHCESSRSPLTSATDPDVRRRTHRDRHGRGKVRSLAKGSSADPPLPPLAAHRRPETLSRPTQTEVATAEEVESQRMLVQLVELAQSLAERNGQLQNEYVQTCAVRHDERSGVEEAVLEQLRLFTVETQKVQEELQRVRALCNPLPTSVSDSKATPSGPLESEGSVKPTTTTVHRPVLVDRGCHPIAALQCSERGTLHRLTQEESHCRHDLEEMERSTAAVVRHWGAALGRLHSEEEKRMRPPGPSVAVAVSAAELLEQDEQLQRQYLEREAGEAALQLRHCAQLRVLFCDLRERHLLAEAERRQQWQSVEQEARRGLCSAHQAALELWEKVHTRHAQITTRLEQGWQNAQAATQDLTAKLRSALSQPTVILAPSPLENMGAAFDEKTWMSELNLPIHRRFARAHQEALKATRAQLRRA